MNNEDLEKMVVKSVMASKEIADGTMQAPREHIAPAQQFINEVSNFYNVPKNREIYLKDIRDYIAKPFDCQLDENEAKMQKAAKSLKTKSCVYAGAAAVTLAAAFTLSGWFALGTAGFGVTALSNYFRAGAYEGFIQFVKLQEAHLREMKTDIEETQLGEFEKILLDNEAEIKKYI